MDHLHTVRQNCQKNEHNHFFHREGEKADKNKDSLVDNVM